MGLAGELYLVDFVVFLLVGFMAMVRLKATEGSLRLARICFFMVAFCAAGGFLITGALNLIPDPLNTETALLIKQWYVPSNLFAMSVLAFLASFTIFATYRGKGRRLLVLIIFIIALIPTAYLTFTYNQIIVKTAPPEYAESYLLTLPPLTNILYASCGIPLALIPVLAFGNSLIQARRRRDKILTYRATMMFTSLILNEIAYLLFVFFTGIILLATLLSWIPIELFLLFAVFRITSPPQPET